MAYHKIYIGMVGDIDGYKEVPIVLSDSELETVRKVQKALNATDESDERRCWIRFSIYDPEASRKMNLEIKRMKAAEERKKAEERANIYKDDANPILAAYRKALQKKKEKDS